MRICAVCGNIIPDDENTCPVCSKQTEISPADIDMNTESSEIIAQSDTSAAEETPVSSGIPSVTDRDKKEADPVNERSLLRAVEGRSKKILLIIAIIALAAVLSGLVLSAVRLKDDSERSKQRAYLEFLCGTWISDPFVYSKGETPSREILTINKDLTYSCTIVTSPDNNDTFDPDTWSVSDEDKGSFEINTENSALVLSYNFNGESVKYMRYIVKLDTGFLTLREFYNDTLSDYYDVTFRKG